MIDFSGVWVPLVTPFRAGALDLAALRKLVAHLAEQGAAGFVACGSTGEAAMLDEAEQGQVLRAAIAASNGKPVLMGLAGVRPAQVAQRAQRLAEAHRVTGFLLPAPAYVKPSQAGIIDFFVTVADASPVPIVVYDVPARTGVRIALPTLLALAAHPRIAALKDCSADRAAASAIVADGRLALLAGNDDEILDQLARGAVGAIAASAHLCTAQFVALCRLMAAGRLDEARQVWQPLRPLVEALFAEPNPSVIKGLLARQGWLAGELRSPMLRASATSIDNAARLRRSRQPPVTGGKKATSAPAEIARDSSAMTWSSAQRTARPRASTCACLPPRAISASRSAASVAPSVTSTDSLPPRASRSEAK